MDWIENLSGEVVGLDTAPIIYFIERNRKYIETIRPFFEALDNGNFHAVTSTVTLTEVLVHPLRLGDVSLARSYEGILLGAENLDAMPLSPDVALEAARIRAEHNVRTPDAIQLATAKNSGDSHFVTNDSRLPEPPGLKIVVLDELLANTERGI